MLYKCIKKVAICDTQTHLSRVWSASLNLFPLSFSPLAVTQSWLRKRFAREARKKINMHFIIIDYLLAADKVELSDATCQTDRSALCRRRGSLLSLTQWTEAGRDTAPCWDSASCCGSSPGTQSCVWTGRKHLILSICIVVFLYSVILRIVVCFVVFN